MEIDILSLFPEYFEAPLNCSILGKAQKKGLVSINHVNIRDFALDRHKTVDDRPYGGGPGMVMMAQPIVDAIRSVKREDSVVVYMSPQGSVLNAKMCEGLAQAGGHLIILCGHYEGIDDRVIDLEVDYEISIGDYVLTNGGPAALVLIDSISRFIPGVIGHPEAAYQDSFHQEEVFDGPHYTRPEEFEGLRVPKELMSGNHKEIETYRSLRAREKRMKVRPELTVTE